MTASPQGPELSSTSGSYTGSFGVVALAAYRPDESLFERQLQSIQAQSHANFECLITVDGDPAIVRELVAKICGDDDRFRVLGFEERLGFHLNFERVLKVVPTGARWIALSDQDDYWYPDKIATLLPFLAEADLVTGQARVVSTRIGDGFHPESVRTSRRNVPAADMIATNQATGSMCVFRTELLALALPFPQLGTPSQYHDHWLGLCALAGGGILIRDSVLQDYIQHEGNVVGESSQALSRSVRNTLKIVRRFEPNASVASISRLIYKTGLCWRTLMATTLLSRLRESERTAPEDVTTALRMYASPKSIQIVSSLAKGVARRNVSPVRFLEIALGVLIRPWLGKA